MQSTSSKGDVQALVERGLRALERIAECENPDHVTLRRLADQAEAGESYVEPGWQMVCRDEAACRAYASDPARLYG